MSSTRKTIVFFLSFFSTIIFLSLVSLVISPLVSESNEYVLINVIYPLFFSLGFIFFLFSQSLVKYLLNKRLLSKDTVLLTLRADGFSLTDKIWIYLIIALIYFVPVLAQLSISLLTLPRIILFITSLIIGHLLIKLSSNRLSIHFLRNGIIVNGLDLRVDFPMIQSQSTYNDSGYYSYLDIESYFILPESVDLYIALGRGKISCNIDDETKRQVKGILLQQKIEVKNFN